MLRSKSQKLQSGFTLVEVAVSGTIMVIIAAGAAGLQYIMNQNQSLVFENSIKVEMANGAASMITREIRTARPADNGGYLIESANSLSLVIYSDVDHDGQSERVRYFLEGTDLKKGTIEPTGNPITYPASSEKVRTIAENVRNGSLPVFYYYNADWPTVTTGNPLPVPADQDTIRLIRIHIRTNSTSDPQSDYILESFAQIRTLKDNL